MTKTNYEALVFSTENALVRGAVTQGHYDAIVSHIKHSEISGAEEQVYKLTKLRNEVMFELSAKQDTKERGL